VTEPWSTSIALLLFFAGFTKIRHPQIFREQLADFRILPYRLTYPFAFGIPLLEIALGGGLLTPSLRDASVGVSILVFGMFTSLLGLTLARGLKISCACFGASGSSGIDAAGPHSIARNLAIIALCAIAFAFPLEATPAEAFVLSGLSLVAVFLVGEIARLSTVLARENRKIREGAVAAVASSGAARG
jgi:hypothetical protein